MMQSSLLDSALGPIEYALQGEGFPILVSHGAAGGFDQALLIAAPLAASGFQLVAPSRDGYLRSPLTPASSPQTQADKYAWLLDHLGLDSCVALGVSVGGPSAIEFALRHPRRCKALVLISSIVMPVRPAYLSILPEPLVLSILRSPAHRFVLMRAPERILLEILGVTSQDLRRTSSDSGASRALKETLLAARDAQGLRVQGALADITSARDLPRYPFADVQMPALVVHGSKDRFAPFRLIAEAVARMPHARLEEIRGAGHLCIITHSNEVSLQVARFLRTVLN